MQENHQNSGNLFLNLNIFETAFKALKDYGCRGFIDVQHLMQSKCNQVPSAKGIYFVIFPIELPKFLKKSVGGRFKGKDPTVSVEVLRRNWVENAHIIYIGKAGRSDSQVSLKSRLKGYMRFGQGEPAAHYGGRFIWQLQNYLDLLICWKIISDSDPLLVERCLLRQFKDQYGKLPFANLRM